MLIHTPVIFSTSAHLLPQKFLDKVWIVIAECVRRRTFLGYDETDPAVIFGNSTNIDHQI